MQYRTYAIGIGIVMLLFFVIFAAAFLSAFGSAGVPAVILFGIILIPAYAVGVYWVRNAVDQYGGVPMPGMLGLFGVNIEEDDDDDDDRDGDATPKAWQGSGGRLIDKDDPADPDARRCPKCGAITVGTDSAYCRACGASLAP